MKGVSYRKFLEFSPTEAKEYIRLYVDFQLENEKRSNPGLNEEELPRKYLDEVLKDSHCTTRHSTDDIGYLIDRLVVRPPDKKHPDPQYSTFESDVKARYAVENILYASAKNIASRITDYNVRTKDDIVLERDYGEICGSGVAYRRGLVYFVLSKQVIAVLGVDKYNPFNDIHCRVKTAYPDLSYGKTVRSKTREATELFYEKLLKHPSKTLRQAWALVLSGYNITAVNDLYLVDKYGKDSWDSKKLSVDFHARNKQTGQDIIFSALFHEFKDGSTKASYSKYKPDINLRQRIDEVKVPEFVSRDIPEIKSILANPDIVIKNCREKALEKLTKMHNNDEPIT